MRQGITHKDAVRLAKEKLGEVSSAELAAYIQDAFGLAIKSQIVTVLLGSIQERAALDSTGQSAYAKIARWKEENPEEAKKMAALVKRRETAKRKNAELAAAKALEAHGAIVPAEPVIEPAQAVQAMAGMTADAGPRDACGAATAEAVGLEIVNAGRAAVKNTPPGEYLTPAGVEQSHAGEVNHAA